MALSFAVLGTHGVQVQSIQGGVCSSWLMCCTWHSGNWRHVPAPLSADGLNLLLSLF